MRIILRNGLSRRKPLSANHSWGLGTGRTLPSDTGGVAHAQGALPPITAMR